MPEGNESAWQTATSLVKIRSQVGEPTSRVSVIVSLGSPRVGAGRPAPLEHHGKRSFKEELILLLARHGVQYDERYLWD